MKILIIAYYFPPRNTIASHRPYAWARAWAEAGHQVTVASPEETTGDTSLEKDCGMCTVLRIPRTRFHEAVLRAGTASIKQGRTEEHKPRPGFQRVRRWLKQTGAFREMRMPSLADRWTRQCIRAIRSAYEQQGRSPWDMVVSTANPYAVHVAGYHTKKRGYARIFVADYRDLWTENPVYTGLPLFRTLERRREKKILSLADAVVTVSQSLADSLRKRTTAPVLVSYNGYDEDMSAPETFAGFPAGKHVLLYTGSLYRSHRDPEPLLRSLRRWVDANPKAASKVHCAFAGHNVDHLSDLIRRYDLSEYAVYYGAVPFRVSQAMQHTADALLFIESSLPEAEGYVTGKLFEYLQKGKPVVALGITERAESWQIMNSYGVARLLRHEQDYADMFETLASHAWEVSKPEHIKPLRFSRRTLARKLMEDLYSAIPALTSGHRS